MFMKRLLFLFAIILSCATLRGQNAYTTEVHLKNGSIIKGFVVEHNPEGNIKIQTADGSLFVYASSEVERVVAGSTNNVQQPGYNTERGGYMERKKNNLRLDGKQLSEADLRQMFGNKEFDTYKGATRQCRSGRTLIACGWASVGVGLVCSFISGVNAEIVGYDINSQGAMVEVYSPEPVTFVTGVVSLVAGNLMLPTGYVLRGIGRGRLSRLAEGYNAAQTTQSSTLQLGPALMTTFDNKPAMGLLLNLSF